MPDIIRLLPETVANQIAAGEVVQRPASAAKELIENAIDAGATKLEIIIEDAGKTLLQVIDNGKGMTETDARMAFERHATSKILKAEDLEAIRSFGFRGEALASIAAVARVEMRSRHESRELGTHIVVEATRVVSQKAVATPVGTNIAMRNLFFNTPARRNFLKTDSVELKHILEEVHRMAIAYPQVTFSVFNQGKELLHLDAASQIVRLDQLWQKKPAERLIPIDQDMGDVRMHGFVSKVDHTRKTRGEQYFFVNNRFIKSGYLHHAVMTAYSGLIPDGHYPSYVLFIELDPSQVDINVHPTKHEIKFQDERIMYRYLNVAVRHAIGKFTVGTELPFDSSGATRVGSDNGRNSSQSSRYSEPIKPQHAADNLSEWRKAFEGIDQFSIPSRESTQAESLFHGNKTAILSSRANDDASLSDAPAHGKVVQINQRYLVTGISSGMLIIDQRAAHERILYEELIEKHHHNAIGRQTLLFPLTLRWSATETVALTSGIETLKEMGFEIEPFSSGEGAGQGQTYIVRAIPEGLQESVTEETIRVIVQSDNAGANNSIQDAGWFSLVRSMAIKHGKVLSGDEQSDLIARLFSCAEPLVRPGGGKTFITQSMQDLALKF